MQRGPGCPGRSGRGIGVREQTAQVVVVQCAAAVWIDRLRGVDKLVSGWRNRRRWLSSVPRWKNAGASSARSEPAGDLACTLPDERQNGLLRLTRLGLASQGIAGWS